MPEINDDEPDGVEPPGKPDAGIESDDTDPEGADASTFDGWDADGEFDGDEGESDVADKDGVDTSNSDAAHYDTLPDGRDSITIGDPEGYAEFNHRQGDNTLGYQGTCGIVSCENVLKRYGKDVSEDDLVRFAADPDREWCTMDESDQDLNGATIPLDRARILGEHGVMAHVERNQTIDNLAEHIENDHGVIASVNAGELWDDPDSSAPPGRTNHAVTVTGTARNPETEELQGFYINDSGTGESGKFLDVDKMRDAWQDCGGKLTVSNEPLTRR